MIQYQHNVCVQHIVHFFFLCAEVCTYMYVYTLSNVLDNWPVGRLRECLKELNEVKGYSKVRNYLQVCIQVCSAWIIARAKTFLFFVLCIDVYSSWC